MDVNRVLYVYFSEFTEGAHRGQIIHTTNKLNDCDLEVTLLAAGDVLQFADQNDLTVSSKILTSPTTNISEKLSRIIYYVYAIKASRSHDVIFTRDISFLKVLSVIPDRIRPPILYEAHQCYSALGEFSEREERTRLERADAIITQSKGTATALESLGLEVYSVIPNAANAELLPDSYPQDLESKFRITPDTKTVVYSGSLDKWKNDIELLLQTFNALDWDDKRLLILGGPDARINELIEFINQEELDANQIHFTGEVSQREVFRYLAIADIGVVPLKPDNLSASTFTSPIKVFEYDLSEIAIVAADVPAIKNLDLETVHRYQPGDVDSMRGAFLTAIAADIEGKSKSYTYTERAARIEAALTEL